MNKEVYKEMCCKIYEGESWDRMINCLERKDKEIERLQKDLTYYQEYSADLLNKNNTFENIIKEAKEYIEERYNGEVLTHTFDKDNVGELLEILDKGE